MEVVEEKEKRRLMIQRVKAGDLQSNPESYLKSSLPMGLSEVKEVALVLNWSHLVEVMKVEKSMEGLLHVVDEELEEKYVKEEVVMKEEKHLPHVCGVNIQLKV